MQFSFGFQKLCVFVYSKLLFLFSHPNRSEENEKAVDSNAKRDKPVVRPEEIPPVPENRFLLRRDAPVINTEPEPYATIFFLYLFLLCGTAPFKQSLSQLCICS